MGNRGQWQKGQSGNPKGRPARPMSQALEVLAEHDSFGDITNRQLVARLVWQALICGSIPMVDGRTLELNTKEWLDLVKWLHRHVDGSIHAGIVVPPAALEPGEMEATGDSGKEWVYDYSEHPQESRQYPDGLPSGQELSNGLGRSMLLGDGEREE